MRAVRLQSPELRPRQRDHCGQFIRIGPGRPLVPPLHHHPDHRFGARGAQHHAALAGQPRLDAADAAWIGGHRGRVKAARDLHIEQYLRKALHARGEFGEGLAGLLHDGQHLQGAHMPSPVVVLSRHRIWPEVSPPRMPPVSRSSPST